MIVNFRARGISRGVRKLARTPTLKKKNKLQILFSLYKIGKLKVKINLLHVSMSIYIRSASKKYLQGQHMS